MVREKVEIKVEVEDKDGVVANCMGFRDDMDAERF